MNMGPTWETSAFVAGVAVCAIIIMKLGSMCRIRSVSWVAAVSMAVALATVGYCAVMFSAGDVHPLEKVFLLICAPILPVAMKLLSVIEK